VTIAEGIPDPPVQGGAAEWSPSILPPVPELTEIQKLACAFRILARSDFTENIAGHITCQTAGGDLLVNPWGLWWHEITSSDICTVDMDARVVAGRWDVTPAVHIHTEIHRRRGAAARVVIHNHPYHATVLAALGLVPELIHQTAAMFGGDLTFVDEYSGEVATASLGAELAERIGDRHCAILANHGVIVTGTTIEEATYRAATLERQCRLTFDVVTSGRSFTRLPAAFVPPMKKSLLERGPDFFWGGAVRQIIREQPEVLD